MSLQKTLLIVIVTLLASTALVSAQDDSAALDLTPPELGDFDPAEVQDIDVSSYAILPEITDHAREIYARQLADGEGPLTFSKVGDCMTSNAYFMAPFGLDDYDLGEFVDLQPVVDTFGATNTYEDFNSFSFPGMATASGFTTASVLDSIWADPDFCSADESPLSCEYRITDPTFSIIMFGTNDVFYLDEASYDFYLRNIILETIAQDVIPVMSTFPTRPEFPEKTELFNQIIINIATDYDVPLINLWQRVQELPNAGIDEVETIHLSVPESGQTGHFTPDNLETGYTVRNLVVLQSLDKLWAELNG